MLDMLSLNQKKWLVDNRMMLTNQITAGVMALTAGAINSLCTIVMNQHSYEFKRLARCERDEDFIVLEDVSMTNDLRNRIRPNWREREKEELDEVCGKTSYEKKKKKKGGKKK